MKVLVIGASRGLGLELARQDLAAGDTVTATARGEAALAELTASGARAIELDVTQPANVLRVASELGASSFDRAVLCAGVYGPRSVSLTAPTKADFDDVMQTNVLAAMRLLPIVARLLAPGGVLAVLSSEMGSIGARSDSSGWLYRASKAALNSLLKDVSLMLDGRAICIAVHPGWVRTSMGGPEAPLGVERSAGDLRRLFGSLQASDNGSFLDHEGRRIPW